MKKKEERCSLYLSMYSKVLQSVPPPGTLSNISLDFGGGTL